MEKKILKKEAQPYCPLCNTRMIPADGLIEDDSGEMVRAYLCNCNPATHDLVVEL